MRIPAKQTAAASQQLNATSTMAKSLVKSQLAIRITLADDVSNPSYKIEYLEDWDTEDECFLWSDEYDSQGKVGRNKPSIGLYLEALDDTDVFKHLNVGERVIVYQEDGDDVELLYGVVETIPKNRNGKYGVLVHTEESNVLLQVTTDSLAVRYAKLTDDYFLTKMQHDLFTESLIDSGIAKSKIEASIENLCESLVAARLTPFDLCQYLTEDDVENTKFHKVYMKKHKLEGWACYHLATGEVYEADDDVEDEPTVWDKLNDMPLTALSKLYTTTRTKTNTEEVETKKSLIIKHLREICKSPKRHANLERMVDKA